MEDDFCIQPEEDCSSTIPTNQSFTTFSVGPIPCYVGIISDTFSCIATVTIVAIYMAWNDIRQKMAQSIVTFIAISDFFTAAGYMTIDIHLLIFNSNRFDQKQLCGVFTIFCEIQSYIVTCATMSSYIWTIILAVHFYLTVVKIEFSKKLLPLYHLVGWGIPILIAFPLLCAKKLAYAPFVTGIWCYMEIYRNSPPFDKSIGLAAIFTQVPEIAAFLLIFTLFFLTWVKIHKKAKRKVEESGLLVNEKIAAMESVTRVGRILLFIPVFFVLLRVWAVVQYFYILYLELGDLTDSSGRCIPEQYKTAHVALGVLQAIGAGGQGWTNAIFYIFLSPKIRQRLFCNHNLCVRHCLTRNQDSQQCSETHCSTPVKSVSIDPLVRDWNMM